ncbi:GAF domain-containing protein [Candidatus Poribacteria bacterium]
MGGSTDYSLDLIVDLIRPVLETTERLTNVRLSIARAEDSRFLIYSALPHFCREHLQADDSFKQVCRECDRRHMDLARSSGQRIIYRCDNLDLTEFIVPVRVREEIRLFIVGESIRSEDKLEEELFTRIKSIGSDLNDQEILEEMRRCIPVLSNTEIEEVAKIVEAFCPLVAELLESRINVVELSALRAIAEITRDMRMFQEPDELLLAVARTISEVTDSDACSIWEIDREKDRLFNLAAHSILSDILRFMIMQTNGITGKVVKDGTSELIPDLSLDDRVDPVVSPLLVRTGYHSMISVALETHDGRIGAVNIYRRLPDAYAGDDVELLERASDIVSEALDKARLLRRTQAVAEMAALFDFEAGDASTIYDRAAEIAAKAIGAQACSIFFVNDEGDALRLAGTTGIRKDHKPHSIIERRKTDEIMERHEYDSVCYDLGEGVTGWIWKNGRSLRIYDNRDEDELKSIDPSLKWADKHPEKAPYPPKGEELHTFIGVPILIQGRVIGVIRATIKAVTQPVFSKQDHDILESLAAQIGFARERSHLIEESERRLESAVREIEDVSEISQSLVQDPEPEAIAHQVVQSLKLRKPHWKWSSVRLCDFGKSELYFASVEGPGVSNRIRRMRFPIAEDSIGSWVYQEQEIRSSPDLSEDPSYECPFKEARSSVTIPISFGNHRYGVLGVDSSQLHGFSEEDTIFLRLLSAQLAIALEMSRMIEQTREQMQSVAHQLVAPLFALRTHTDNLLGERITPERALVVLNSINAQAKIAARMATNLSFVSLILGGKLSDLRGQIHLVTVSLYNEFVDLAKDYQPMTWENETEIFVIEDGFPRASIDKRIFPQAAGNIIDNAVKYSDPYTNIIIWGERKENNLLINIESEGLRLSEEDVERIFDRGYRSKEASRIFPTGTGLGLWLARHIMKLHNGDLFVVPTDPSGKTRFVMSLPLSRSG